MDDLTITKLCVEAMFNRSLEDYESSIDIYDPLHDDAQAMALVKKFRLSIDVWTNTSHWVVNWGALREKDKSDSEDLNRAICECVAKMQLSKAGKNEARAQG